jgi:phosphohistidine phosphatase
VKIYVIRHSRAVEPGPWMSDDARWLDARGREVAAAVGAKLRERGVAFDALVTSPLVRAVQTAELVAAAAGYAGIIEAVPALAPGGPTRAVVEDLSARGAAVAAVGHEPSISALVAALAGRAKVAGLRPCQVVLVEDGAIAWSLDPDRLAFDRAG